MPGTTPSGGGQNRMTKTIVSFADRFAGLLHLVGIWVAIPLLVGIVTLDVALRHVFNAPLLWGNEVSSLILLVVFFACLPLCTARRAHVRMGLLYDHLPSWMKGIANILSGLAGMLLTGTLAYQSFLSAHEALTFGDGAEFFDFPYWPILGFMGVCSAAMVFFFCAEIWRAFETDNQE